MSTVRLQHPDLPDQPISVPEQAVPHHRAAGWVPVDETETPPDAEESEKPSPASTTAAADAAPESAPESAPDAAPRRRAPKEAQK